MKIDPKLPPYNCDGGMSAAYERKSVGVSLLDGISWKPLIDGMTKPHSSSSERSQTLSSAAEDTAIESAS